MSCYNVQLIEYPSGYQLRIYNKAINYSDTIDNIGIKTKLKPKEENKELIDAERSLESSLNRTVNTIYDYARSNVWSYFLTFTINPQIIDNTIDNYEEFTKSIRKYFDNLKQRYAPDLKYLIVPELHKDKTKYHFHALLSDVGNIKFEYSGKVSVGKYVYDYEKCPWGRKIYNMPLWKFGWSTATVVEDSAKVSGYMCKYITKDLCNTIKGKRRFWASLNLNKPSSRFSLVDYGFLNEFLNVYEKEVLYQKSVSVEDCGLTVKYYEFSKDIDLSFFEDYTPYKSNIENQIYKKQQEESKNDYLNSLYSHGFKIDTLDTGRKIFNDN